MLHLVVLEFGVVMLALGLALVTAVLLFIMVFVYTHLDKKLLKKFRELEGREKELQDSMRRVNEARANEGKEIRKRLEAIEDKVGIAAQAEAVAVEAPVEKAKVKAVAKSGKK